MAALMSGRPLLVQPFTSLCSMSVQQRCLTPAGLGLCHTHVTVHSVEHPKHAEREKLSAARSISAGSRGAVCNALPVCGGTVSPSRSAVASAAELPDPRAEQTGVQPNQAQLSVRQQHLRRPAASTAVVGWRVRDISAMGQDIGIVSEVQFATMFGSRRCGPVGSHEWFAVPMVYGPQAATALCILVQVLRTDEASLGYTVLRIVKDCAPNDGHESDELLEMHLIPFVPPILQRLDEHQQASRLLCCA
jgi:hypothetical protein